MFDSERDSLEGASAKPASIQESQANTQLDELLNSTSSREQLLEFLKEENSTNEIIDQNIERLGDQTYAVRQEAYTELLNHPEALDKILASLSQKIVDPEVRQRIEGVAAHLIDELISTLTIEGTPIIELLPQEGLSVNIKPRAMVTEGIAQAISQGDKLALKRSLQLLEVIKGSEAQTSRVIRFHYNYYSNQELNPPLSKNNSYQTKAVGEFLGRIMLGKEGFNLDAAGVESSKWESLHKNYGIPKGRLESLFLGLVTKGDIVSASYFGKLTDYNNHFESLTNHLNEQHEPSGALRKLLNKIGEEIVRQQEIIEANSNPYSKKRILNIGSARLRIATSEKFRDPTTKRLEEKNLLAYLVKEIEIHKNTESTLTHKQVDRCLHSATIKLLKDLSPKVKQYDTKCSFLEEVLTECEMEMK